MSIERIKESISVKIVHLFYVHVPANVYAGKYYDYRTLKVPVLAETATDAVRLVNENKLNVLGWAKFQKAYGRCLIQARVPANKSVFFKDTYFVKMENVFGRMGAALCYDGKFYNVHTKPSRL